MSPGLPTASSDVHAYKQAAAQASANPQPAPPATALANKEHDTEVPGFPTASTAAEIFKDGRVLPVGKAWQLLMRMRCAT